MANVERLPQTGSGEVIFQNPRAEGVAPSPGRRRQSSGRITSITDASVVDPVELQREIDAKAAELRAGKAPEQQAIDALAAQLLEESGGAPPPTREDLAKQIAEERLRAEGLKQRAETAEQNSDRLREMWQRTERDKKMLAQRASVAEGSLGALQREADQATSGEATALDALAAERKKRRAAENRATEAESRAALAEAALQREQERDSNKINDPHGYYGRLGITPSMFADKSEEEIAAILDGLRRGYGKAHAKILNVPVVNEEMAKKLKKVQGINEALDRLGNPRYR